MTGTAPTTWSNSDLISFNNPGLNLGAGTTNGTFALEASWPENVGALHYVSTTTTVGTGSGPDKTLLPGQIVVSFRNPVVLPGPLATTFGADNSDLVLFTPDTPGDYTSGTFEMLLDSKIRKPDASLANIHAVSIVEKRTTVGLDTILEAGTFLLARSDAAGTHSDVLTYRGIDDTEDPQTLLLGADAQFGLASNEQIQGLELIEQPITIGGVPLPSGTLLMTVSNAMAPRGRC